MLVLEDILGRCAPLLGIDPMRTAPAQLLPRRPEHALRTAGPPSRAAASRLGADDSRGGDVASRLARGGAVQRHARARQARARAHPGEVRHLVQPDRVQPGRRAGARLQGRLGADQPRRHRDGAGPAHQDAAGRGHHARRSRWRGCAWRRPAPTRCPTPRRPRRAPAPTSTAARSRTPASRSAIGCSPSPAAARRPPARRPHRRRRRPAARPPASTAASSGTSSCAPPTSSASSCRRPASTAPRACTGTRRRCRARRSSTSPTARRPPRSRSTASPAPTAPGGSTSSTTSVTASRR